MKLVRVIDTVAACAVENHFTPGAPWNVMIESEQGTYPNLYRTFVTMNCMHCENPPCKTACDGVKAFAISKNELGVVLIDYEKCIGCGYCAAVCPYGVPQITQTIRARIRHPWRPSPAPSGTGLIARNPRSPRNAPSAGIGWNRPWRTARPTALDWNLNTPRPAIWCVQWTPASSAIWTIQNRRSPR